MERKSENQLLEFGIISRKSNDLVEEVETTSVMTEVFRNKAERVNSAMFWCGDNRTAKKGGSK